LRGGFKKGPKHVSGMPPSLAKVDFEALVAAYDPESRDTFVSLYLDLTDDRRDAAVERRAREVRAALAEGEGDVEAFDRALAEAARLAKKTASAAGARGVAAFASPAHGFGRAFALAAPVENRVVLDSSPYVRPLARHVDEHEAFVLVLIDGEHGVVYLVDEGIPDLAGRSRMSLIGRHKKGGMSQMRYQRHRQGRVEKFYAEIAGHVDRLVEGGEASRVFVAGPGQAKRQFVDHLGAKAREGLLAVEDVDFKGATADDVLLKRFMDLARREEAEASAEAVRMLAGAFARGDLTAGGGLETARAARDGRVDLLVVEKDHTVPGGKCETHQSYFPPGERCACGSEGTKVDLANEAIEGVLRTEGSVEFVKRGHPILREIDGLGALLRW